ncbi:hypothetical protein IL306_002292, partial [Fusarium sp. DS 682]
MTEPQAVAAFEICATESSFCLQRYWPTYPGFNIGSAKIDQGFEAIALDHLEDLQSLPERDTKFVARYMCNSDGFQDYKHKFNADNFDKSILKIPFTKSREDGASPALLEMAVPFTDGNMTRLFDGQIELMWERIRYYPDCLETVTKTGRASDLNYIILAGGLGSSIYVQSRLEELLTVTQSHLSNNIKLVKSGNARLADCMGLVYYAGRNPDVFSQRLHRVPFGTAAQVMVNEKGRFREFLKRVLSSQSKEGEKAGEVEWFIFKATSVPESRICKSKQTSIFSPGTQPAKRLWKAGILSSFESDPLRLKKSKGKAKPLTSPQR